MDIHCFMKYGIIFEPPAIPLVLRGNAPCLILSSNTSVYREGKRGAWDRCSRPKMDGRRVFCPHSHHPMGHTFHVVTCPIRSRKCETHTVSPSRRCYFVYCWHQRCTMTSGADRVLSKEGGSSSAARGQCLWQGGLTSRALRRCGGGGGGGSGGDMDLWSPCSRHIGSTMCPRPFGLFSKMLRSTCKKKYNFRLNAKKFFFFLLIVVC